MIRLDGGFSGIYIRFLETNILVILKSETARSPELELGP
jgi:hypothetical protein